jgi:hypothetical protein
MKPRATSADPRPFLRASAFILLAVGLSALILIAAGAFDPRPLGPAMITAPGDLLSVEAGASTYRQLDLLPSSPFSLRGSAALVEGETDSGYGLSVGDDGAWLTAAVSPLGYAAVWQETAGGERDYLFPWQPWPHVRQGLAENEIWLDVVQAGAGARVTVRINRERLWAGETTARPGGGARWAGTFGDGATVRFGETALFIDRPAER